MNYFCKECNIDFEYSNTYYRHRSVEHFNLTDKVYICSIDDCKKPFIIKSDLEQHQNRVTHSFKTHSLIECPLRCGVFTKTETIEWLYKNSQC